MSAQPHETRTRLLVLSDWALVGEAIRTALAGRGLDPIVVAWPRGHGLHDHLRTVTALEPDVLLVVCDLGIPIRLNEACRLIEGSGIRSIVLSGEPQGPPWGAVLASGAEAVLPTTASLQDVTRAINNPERHRFQLGVAHQRRLRMQWNEVHLEQGELIDRMQQLTPRELVVLKRICDGDSVRTIAVSGEVAETTVRSQVKSVLRKLGVRSQLAAVASYRRLIDQGRVVS